MSKSGKLQIIAKKTLIAVLTVSMTLGYSMPVLAASRSGAPSQYYGDDWEESATRGDQTSSGTAGQEGYTYTIPYTFSDGWTVEEHGGYQIASTWVWSGGSDDSESSDSSSDSSGPSAEELRIMREEEEIAKEQTENRINGSVYGTPSTTGGSFRATNIDGAAVTTPRDVIAANLGLNEYESAYVTTWNLTAKTSPAAAQALNIAAATAGAVKTGPMFQLNIDKLSEGNRVSLEGQSGSLVVKVGIPVGFRTNTSERFAVVRVVDGGAIEILQDKDNSPYTITFDAKLGNAAYALIKLP